jgi:hypothetical protein
MHGEGKIPATASGGNLAGGFLNIQEVSSPVGSRGHVCYGSGIRLPYAPPYTRNPNLKPVGKGFGFLVFDLKEYCCGMT